MPHGKLTQSSPLRVGLAVSLSGSLAPMGIDARRGLELWADDARRSGTPIELVVRDDRSDPLTAGECVTDLLAHQRIDLLAGPYSSGLTRAVAPIAEARGVVLWNHGGAADDIHQRGFQSLVSILAPASGYFIPALGWVRTGSVLVLRRASSPFSVAITAGAEAEARRQGRPTEVTSYPRTPAAVGALLDRLGSSPPDLLLAAGRLADDIALARALRDRGLAIPTALVATPVRAFRHALGPAADGFTGPSQWEPTARVAPDVGPPPGVFAGRFARRFGVQPDYPAAQAYAAGLVMSRCVEMATAIDQQALRAAAAALDCTTLLGRFRIDPLTGAQIGHTVRLITWVRGERRLIRLPPSPG